MVTTDDQRCVKKRVSKVARSQGGIVARSPPVSSYLAVLKPAGADKSFVRELPPLD